MKPPSEDTFPNRKSNCKMKEKKPYVAPKMQTYNIQVRQFLCMSSAESILYGEDGNGIEAE